MTIPSGLKSLMQASNALRASLILLMPKCFFVAKHIIILTNKSSEMTLNGICSLTDESFSRNSSGLSGNIFQSPKTDKSALAVSRFFVHSQ